MFELGVHLLEVIQPLLATVDHHAEVPLALQDVPVLLHQDLLELPPSLRHFVAIRYLFCLLKILENNCQLGMVQVLEVVGCVYLQFLLHVV